MPRSRDLITATVDSRELVRRLSRLPKEVQNQIRTENQALARGLAQELIVAAKVDLFGANPPQADLVANAIYPKRDRLVRVDIGGAKQVGTKYKREGQQRARGAAAGQLLYGSEFGSSGKSKDRSGRNMGARFVKPHKESGYWIKPTHEKYALTVFHKWRENLAQYLDRVGAS